MKSKISIITFWLLVSTLWVFAECDITPSINNFPAIVNTNSGSISLSASPAGGVFSGNGVLFNAFNPILSGLGAHEITYTYADPATGCVSVATETILIFTYVDIFITYQLGTISPKFSLSTETDFDNFDDYTITISDMNGQIWHQKAVSLNQKESLYQFNEIDLPIGMYVATYQNKIHTFSKKVILGR